MNQKSQVAGLAGGALGLGTLALAFGTCCIAPWAVAFLGVSGAVLMARLAFVQPYLVAATVLLLGAAVWLAYRRAAGGACDSAQSRRSRRLLWITGLVVIAIDIASFVPVFY